MTFEEENQKVKEIQQKMWELLFQLEPPSALSLLDCLKFDYLNNLKTQVEEAETNQTKSRIEYAG